MSDVIQVESSLGGKGGVLKFDHANGERLLKGPGY